ncbi:hypothetical protein QFZ56_007889 [Streptomyces achromogenes]|jgi:hypothetical protein|uniref:Uncharacterized protein n=2 Tax=Streptomyces achromogenes TaxID=67255 RepID=A0ABU0QE33_STRAH|nr:hypothetical protein [Streptomyces achromogenes]
MAFVVIPVISDSRKGTLMSASSSVSSPRPSRPRLAAVSGLALTVSLVGAAVAPTTASADTGDRTRTVDCASLYVSDSGGTVHARTRNCTVTWGKNIHDNVYWQTVKFQLLDDDTDGVCAKANAIASDSGKSASFSECDGVWTTKTATLNGRSSNIFIRVAYGSHSQHGKISTNIGAPSGF